MNSMADFKADFKKTTIFQDQFGRQKRKLRISITDRCNFKCVYCMPEHPEWMQKDTLVSFEELYQFCKFMVQQGIEQIRITGGEPLMRQGVIDFIQHLQNLKSIGLKRIGMTTNGHYLKKYATDLKQSGLDDLNISLDSLDEAQFAQITQRSLAPVLAGILAAKKAGFNIKINTVLMKGINENQIINLMTWSKQHGFDQRFIEFMPLDGDQNWSQNQVVSEQEILKQLSSRFKVEICQGQGSNPARHYLVDGTPIGIISTISHSFCHACDRLRLNAQGEFFNCLFAPQGLKIKKEIQQLSSNTFVESALDKNAYVENSVLENASAKNDLQAKLKHYIWHKEQGFHAIQNSKNPSRKISMHMIGG